MSRVESYQKALAIHEGLREQALKICAQIKHDHKLTWWCRPSFWKADSLAINQFKKVLTARTKLVTAIKERDN